MGKKKSASTAAEGETAKEQKNDQSDNQPSGEVPPGWKEPVFTKADNPQGSFDQCRRIRQTRIDF
jgi:hypothetical protein